MTAHVRLRSATAADHATVDNAFATYDLADPASYRRFLRAHARALAAVEQVMAAAPADLPWHPRGPLIAADLAALGEATPPPLSLAVPGEAGLWGIGYVLEGSRLGGGLLAGRVAPGLPAAYLGARHGKGEWRAFLAALDLAGEAGGEPWLAAATAGAHDAFALYAQAAAEEAGDARR